MRAAIGLMGLVVWANAGWSRGLPAHSVQFDPVAGTCRIVLEPAGTMGDRPPRIAMTSGLVANTFGFAIEGGNVAEAVLVHRGARLPFVPRGGLMAEAFLADPVWTQIEQTAPSGGAPDAALADGTDGAPDEPADGADVATATDSLYLTVKDAEGRYSSARYDGLTQTGLLRLLVLACDAEGIEAPAVTEVEHRAAERRLGLADSDRLLLRRLLTARYGAAGTDVGSGGAFTVTDRRFIRQFNDLKGYPSGDYLWPEAVPDLLQEAKATPAERTVSTGATASVADAPESELSRHGDWSVTGTGALCRIATTAVAVEGLAAGLKMEFAVERSGRGGMMAIDLVKPNPFRADMPLAASVDGQGYALAVEPSSSAVIPRPQPDGTMTRDVTLALKRGKSVVIEGVSSVTGAPARVAFSAAGFSAAFAAMALACERSAVMGWIE